MDGIRLAGLRKTYATPTGPVEAVRGIDLDVPAGQTVALLGPNGAGKSTTIDMLLGLLPPDEGSVSIFGAAPSEAIAGGRVGAMLQTGGLLRDLTVRELVSMMGALYPAALPIDEALSVARVDDIAERRTEKLSGGETQRVRFAIGLVSDPDLLVLDEPTVGMDVETRHTFWLTVRAFAQRGKTVLFATHYLEEADAYADRVVLVARGGVVADGAPTTIKSMVGRRRIRATLEGVGVDELARLDGVDQVERRGASVELSCSDSDVALRALLGAYPQARDIEVTGAGLEEAFLQLTGDEVAA